MSVALPEHREPTADEVLTDLRERLDLLQRKAWAVSEAYTLYVETDDLDILADAIGSLRAELPEPDVADTRP